MRLVLATGAIAIILATLLAGCSANVSQQSTPANADSERDVTALATSDEPLLEPTIDPAINETPDNDDTTSQENSSGQLPSLDESIAASYAVEQRITDGDATAKICYLTLDDGPSENTAAILAILNEKNVPATWFIQGNSAQIDLVGDIANAGHAIGLHTYSHDYAQLYASDDAYFADLAAVQEAVSSRIGHTVDIVRFPGGTSNAVSANYNAGIMTRLTQSVPAAGYQYFDWNLSGGDSSSPPPPAIDITNNVLNNTGSMQRVCVLAHDTTIKTTTVEALPAIIDGLREQGYTFGVLSHDTPPFHHQPGN